MGLAVSGWMAGKLSGDLSCSDLDAKHLPAAIHAGLGIHAMRAESATIGVLGELGSDIGVARAAIGAAALGLFAFRIGHKEGLVVQAVVKTSAIFCIKTRVVRLAPGAVKSYVSPAGADQSTENKINPKASSSR